MNRQSFACMLMVLVPAISEAQKSDRATVDHALGIVKQACLSGQQYDLLLDAKGDLVFKNLKPGAEASISITARSANGAVVLSDEKLRLVGDAQVRDCMKPFLPRLLDALLGPSSSTAPVTRGQAPGTLGSAKLPVFKAVASSTRHANFAAQNVLTGRKSWVSQKGDVRGAWIELHIDKSCLVNELGILFDFPKYGGFSQVRSGTVQFGDGTAQKVKFEYQSGWQLAALEPRRADKVRLQIDDIFPVKDGGEVQIIEMKLNGSSCS